MFCFSLPSYCKILKMTCDFDCLTKCYNFLMFVGLFILCMHVYIDIYIYSLLAQLCMHLYMCMHRCAFACVAQGMWSIVFHRFFPLTLYSSVSQNKMLTYSLEWLDTMLLSYGYLYPVRAWLTKLHDNGWLFYVVLVIWTKVFMLGGGA